MSENIEKSVKHAPSEKKTKKKIDFAKFFREAKAEFKKIVWPSKKTIFNHSVIVLAAVMIVGLVVAGFDFLLTNGLRALLAFFN